MHYVPAPDYNNLKFKKQMSRLSALQLFKLGFDTYDIAKAKGVPEASVYRWLHHAREAEHRKGSN